MRFASIGQRDFRIRFFESFINSGLLIWALLWDGLSFNFNIYFILLFHEGTLDAVATRSN